VEVIRHERPGIDAQRPRTTQVGEAAEEILAITVVRKIDARSIPRPITWCNTPGASSLGCLGMGVGYRLALDTSSLFRTNVPYY
jgi:hypothetical protein